MAFVAVFLKCVPVDIADRRSWFRAYELVHFIRHGAMVNILALINFRRWARWIQSFKNLQVDFLLTILGYLLLQAWKVLLRAFFDEHFLFASLKVLLLGLNLVFEVQICTVQHCYSPMTITVWSSFSLKFVNIRVILRFAWLEIAPVGGRALCRSPWQIGPLLKVILRLSVHWVWLAAKYL